MTTILGETTCISVLKNAKKKKVVKSMKKNENL